LKAHLGLARKISEGSQENPGVVDMIKNTIRGKLDKDPELKNVEFPKLDLPSDVTLWQGFRQYVWPDTKVTDHSKEIILDWTGFLQKIKAWVEKQDSRDPKDPDFNWALYLTIKPRLIDADKMKVKLQEAIEKAKSANSNAKVDDDDKTDTDKVEDLADLPWDKVKERYVCRHCFEELSPSSTEEIDGHMQNKHPEILHSELLKKKFADNGTLKFIAD